MADNSGSAATGTQTVSRLPKYTILSAAVIVVVFLGLTLTMMFSLASYPDGDPRWTHALLIYNGFMSFATAAAGVLLGTQIQQGAVDASQQQATDAKTKEQAARDAINNALDAMQGGVTESGGQQGQGSDPFAEARRILLRAVR